MIKCCQGNQSKLKQALEETVIATQSIDYHIEEKIIRGRLEIRQTWLYERQDNLAEGWDLFIALY
jgi:hypothetical protein